MERYSEHSPTELLSIIRQASDYQPMAVEAARSLLEQHRLTPEELSAARLASSEPPASAFRPALPWDRPWRWLKAGFWQLVQRFVPLEQSAENTRGQVRVIALVLLAKFIFGLAQNYQLYQGSFVEGTEGMDAFTLGYFAVLAIVPVVFGLFFRCLKIGWVLLSIVLAYALAGGVFQQSWMAVYAREVADPTAWWQGFWPATMNQLQLLFNLLVLWLVTRKYLMAHFGLGPAARLWPLITIGLVVINFLLIYA